MGGPPSVELQVTVRRLAGSLGFGVDKHNVVVAIKPEGAASRDGLLQRGDQVVAVDGKLLGGRNMSQEISPEEDVYLLTVVRKDTVLRSSLDRLPSAHPAADPNALLHLARALVARQAKEALGLEMTSSNVVKRLLDNGPAMRGGVQLGDVVVAVNGIYLGQRRVVDVLAKAISPIAFTVIRVEERVDSDYEAFPPRGLQPPKLAPPPAMLLIEDEHYQLVDPHGHPPIFAAIAMADKCPVAVRQTDGRDIDACARAMREAKFWRILSSAGTGRCPAILGLYGQQLVAGSLYTVREPIGDTLATAFRHRPNVPIPDVRSIATDLARGLAHMHDECGLVHCNIGLDTIAQGTNGVWKIFNFSSVARTTGVRASCAKVIESSPGVPYVSLAPELVDDTGATDVGAGVDLWAFGLVVATLLNQREPTFSGPEDLSLPPAGSDAAFNTLREAAILSLRADPKRRPRAMELLAYLSNRTANQTSDFSELRLSVVVKRGAKGLGIGVTGGNIIQSLTAGHVLQLGDEIVSVDGVDLAGRHLSQVLKPGAPAYEFIVVRRDHVIGMTLCRLPSDHPVLRPKAELQVIQVAIVRDVHGLGLALSSANVIERVKPDGAADRSGGLKVNDVVIAVDGVQIGAKSVAEAIKADSFETTLVVLRAKPLEHVSITLRPPARVQTATMLRELAGNEEEESGRSSQWGTSSVNVDAVAAEKTDPVEGRQSQPEAPPATVGLPTAKGSSAPLCAPLGASPHSRTASFSDEAGLSHNGDEGEEEGNQSTEPSDSQLLRFLLALQGFDRPTLVQMYRSSMLSRAAAKTDAAKEHNAILRKITGSGSGEATNVDVAPTSLASQPEASEPGMSDVFSRARALLESNLGGTGSNGGAIYGPDSENEVRPPDGSNGEADVEIVEDLPHKSVFGDLPHDSMVEDDENEEEPLAVRIQRLLAQSSNDDPSETRELTSSEQDEARYASSDKIPTREDGGAEVGMAKGVRSVVKDGSGTSSPSMVSLPDETMPNSPEHVVELD